MHKLWIVIVFFGVVPFTIAEHHKPKVHQEWIRKQPNYAGTSMVEDNLGHVAVVTSSSSNTLSVLYDKRGRTVASAIYTQAFVTAVAANAGGKLALAGIPF